MFLSDFSVKRAVTTSMLILVIVVLGGMSIRRLAVDLLPNLEYPMATIMTTYSNVGPQEIENSVTRLIEAQVNRVSGIKRVFSTSKRGASIVRVEFEWGTNMNLATQEIREKLDELGMRGFGLPEGADRPAILRMNLAEIPLMFISVSWEGSSIQEIKKIVDDYLQVQLESVDGVASASALTGAPYEILISLSRSKLDAYGISINQVIQKIRMENLDSSAGRIKEGYKDYLVRTVGKYRDLEEIEETLITIRQGIPVYLKDIAQVKDTYGEQLVYPRHNLAPSVGIMLSKQAGKNTVEVSRKVWEKMDEIKKLLPEGVKVESVFDQAQYIELAIGRVITNALWGGLLAVLILFAFLRFIRPTLIIAVAIPVSMLAAFIPMYFGGMTLNMMSLGGLALAVGMLVDNSIVVLENIFRRMQEKGEDRKTSSSQGSGEVSMAIIASTLTTVAVFLPIAFTPGIAARLFREFALTVTYALFASLLIALTFIPMAASKILAVTTRIREGALLLRLKKWYKQIIQRIITRRKRTIVITLVFFAGSLLLLIPMGKEFMPEGEANQFMMQVHLPYGANIDETNRVVGGIENYMMKFSELNSIEAIVGVGGQGGSGMEASTSEQAMIIITLKKSLPSGRAGEIMESLRKYAHSFPEIERITVMDMSSVGSGMGMGKPVEVKLFGSDLETLNDLATRIEDEMRNIEGIRDIEKTFFFGSPEIEIRLDREKCSRFGLTVAQVSRELEAAIGGQIATRLERMGEEINVIVRLRQEERTNVSDVEKMPIISPAGTILYLKDIARVEKTLGPTDIRRENQKRKIDILANISGRSLGHIMQDARSVISKISMPSGYFVEYGGSFRNMMEAFRDLGIAFALAILLIYMVMASLYESFVHPFAIMFTIPFALIGVIWALFLSGEPISVNAAIGIIMLAGIIVNNGIVLVDYINKLRNSGMNREDAITEAAAVRLRPILMTTLTTILALLPMLFIGGEGAEIYRPLAITVIGGLSFGTVLTLIVLPTIYASLDELGGNVKERMKKLLHKKEIG